MSKEQRKLAAALFADIQGYTAMMQNDEELAVSCLNRFKKAIDREVPGNEGEVIQFYGDGVLALFDSAANAVQCALELQRDFTSDPSVPVRIGLNDGEVIMREDNAFGDSINIASRIESIGIPGSILFSSSIHDQIHNQRKFETHLVGKFHFKNVNREIDVYALKNDGLPIPKKGEVEGKLKEKKLLNWKNVLGALVFLAVAILFTMQLTKPKAGDLITRYENWLGNWNQELEADNNVLLSGQIQFIDSLGVLVGSSFNEYKDMSHTTKNRLFNITVTEDGKTISGKWESLNFMREGSFSFKMKELESRDFVGNYTSGDDPAKYTWNGSRD